MNYKDYVNDKDIEFAIVVLEHELHRRKIALNEGHWLSPQIEGLQADISMLTSSIAKIRKTVNDAHVIDHMVNEKNQKIRRYERTLKEIAKIASGLE